MTKAPLCPATCGAGNAKAPVPGRGGEVGANPARDRDTMNSVVHFEMPYKDRQRMSRFYEKAFGWHTQDLGEAMDHYVLATTTETDERGPIRAGAINGGFYSPKPDAPAPYPALVIGVDDLAAAMQLIRDG